MPPQTLLLMLMLMLSDSLLSKAVPEHAQEQLAPSHMQSHYAVRR